MQEPPTLFDGLTVDAVLEQAPRSLSAEFEAWHRRNPHVFAAFAEAARALKATGRKRYGAKAIWEQMRFHSGIVTTDPAFKLNNNYTSRLARKLLEIFPGEFDDFLELRRLKSE